MNMGDSRDISMAVKMNDKCFRDIEKLAQGEKADESQILEILRFIDARYDCADFRMVCILRTLYDYPALISVDTLSAMKQTVKGFKYWMDEPGEDSMCYWSENHQLLFATCEYLAGQLYPNEVFPNSGMTGDEHLQKGKKALLRWLERRFQFGFSEWHSNTYYEEDVAALSLLIDCAQEEAIARGATILLDLIMLDLALHNFQGFFCAASGRCYEAQKKDPLRQDVLDVMEKAFGFGNIKHYDYTRLSADFILNRKYRLPKAMYDIAHWTEPMEVRDSMGLDLEEISSYFKHGADIDDKGAYLWAMEAFTNPQSVNLTMKMFRQWKLDSNGFLKNLKALDIPVLRHLGLLPLLVKLLNPVTQGIAIQRANTYTYKTKHYMLSTAQRYHPGSFGDQQHIWQATLPGGVTVFTTHPGAAFFEDNARNFSPSSWVGNGVNPDAAQYKNVCLCLYRLNVRKGFLEKERQMFTHAYFPQSKFDETRRGNDRLFLGRKEESYIALFSTEPMENRGDEELIQQGVETGWAAMVASEEEYGGFEDFAREMGMLRLEKTKRGIALKGGTQKNFGSYTLDYRGDFCVDGHPQDTSYPRLSCPFGQVGRNPQEYFVQIGEHSLRLDLKAALREGTLMEGSL